MRSLALWPQKPPVISNRTFFLLQVRETEMATTTAATKDDVKKKLTEI